ncbi:MAG TPA: hypothetical protein VK084_09295, partial [Chitinophagaceae bacterium]|nr:hypothetical protein [Chitinophagaceae bacterium]
MRKFTLTLLSLLMSASVLLAQTDKILEQLPAKNQLTYLKAMQKMSALNEIQLEGLASSLKPYG